MLIESGIVGVCLECEVVLHPLLELLDCHRVHHRQILEELLLAAMVPEQVVDHCCHVPVGVSFDDQVGHAEDLIPHVFTLRMADHLRSQRWNLHLQLRE